MDTKKPVRRRRRRPPSAWRSLRVLVADDHLVFLEGIQALLKERGLNVVDQAEDGATAAPWIGLILLSGLTEERIFRDALRAGVRGFVVKTQAADELVEAIREVSRGGLYVSPGPARAVVEACIAGATGPDTLSSREREVLRLVADGKTTKETAALLRLSVRTIDAHRASIMRRLGIHDTAGLVRYAIRQGLIVP